MRDGRMHQDHFARLQVHNPAFTFDLRTAAELEINQIMIRRPGELLLDSVDVLSRYTQTYAFPDHHSVAVSGARCAAEQVDRPNLRHHSLPHPGGADNRAFIPFHPNMLIRIPMRHKLTDFFRHTVTPLVLA